MNAVATLGSARRRRTGRGQSLVEFAFGLPLILLILLGTLDLGQMFFGYIELRNGVREGASYGARNPTDTAGIRQRVFDHGDIIDTGTSVNVSLSGNYTQAGGEATITVSGQRTFQPITTGFLSMFGLGPVTLTSSARAKVLS